MGIWGIYKFSSESASWFWEISMFKYVCSCIYHMLCCPIMCRAWEESLTFALNTNTFESLRQPSSPTVIKPIIIKWKKKSTHPSFSATVLSPSFDAHPPIFFGFFRLVFPLKYFIWQWNIPERMTRGFKASAFVLLRTTIGRGPKWQLLKCPRYPFDLNFTSRRLPTASR